MIIVIRYSNILVVKCIWRFITPPERGQHAHCWSVKPLFQCKISREKSFASINAHGLFLSSAENKTAQHSS